MDNLSVAYDAIEQKKLPFWKLYNKAGKRLSQCDEEENQKKDYKEALNQLQDEMSTRPAGVYQINAYRNLKGEKGGFLYDITITETNYSMNNRIQQNQPNPFNFDEIYAKAKRDIETTQALERIEKKIDAIGEFILSRNDDDKDNDSPALKFLQTAFINALKPNGGTAAVAAAKTAAPTTPNGFRGF